MYERKPVVLKLVESNDLGERSDMIVCQMDCIGTPYLKECNYTAQFIQTEKKTS